MICYTNTSIPHFFSIIIIIIIIFFFIQVSLNKNIQIKLKKKLQKIFTFVQFKK